MRKGAPDEGLERAAAHEAGHAVAALTFGMAIVHVTVEGGPHLRRGRWSAALGFGVECVATVCLAGPAAEEVVCGPNRRRRSVGPGDGAQVPLDLVPPGSRRRNRW
jgi:hypothetical protein